MAGCLGRDLDGRVEIDCDGEALHRRPQPTALALHSRPQPTTPPPRQSSQPSPSPHSPRLAQPATALALHSRWPTLPLQTSLQQIPLSREELVRYCIEKPTELVQESEVFRQANFVWCQRLFLDGRPRRCQRSQSSVDLVAAVHYEIMYSKGYIPLCTEEVRGEPQYILQCEGHNLLGFTSLC